SSFRSRFSSSTFRLNGRRAEPATRLSRTISYVASPTVSRSRAPKLLLVNLSSWMAHAAQEQAARLTLPGAAVRRSCVHCLHRVQGQGGVRVGASGPQLRCHPDRLHDLLRA